VVVVRVHSFKLRAGATVVPLGGMENGSCDLAPGGRCQGFKGDEKMVEGK
jgi:hypothetical protein